MLDRRRFTFGAILAAVAPAAASQVARAEIPEVPTLGARWEVAQKRGVVELELTLVNLGAEPLRFVAKYGGRPGPGVSARGLDGTELDRILGEVDRRQLVSRIGPRPEWATLASSGGTVAIGTYAFASPRALDQIEVQANVEVELRDVIQLPWTRVAVVAGRVGA